MRTISRTAAVKGVTLQEARLQTHSEATRKNVPTSEPDPETEILKGQMQALQTEMTRMRTEIGKIKSLEKKVEALDTSVNQIQNSLGTLEKGQSTTNSKLDMLVELFTRNFPNVEEAFMEVETEEYINPARPQIPNASSPRQPSTSGTQSQPKSSGYGAVKRPQNTGLKDATKPKK